MTRNPLTVRLRVCGTSTRYVTSFIFTKVRGQGRREIETSQIEYVVYSSNQSCRLRTRSNRTRPHCAPAWAAASRLVMPGLLELSWLTRAGLPSNTHGPASLRGVSGPSVIVTVGLLVSGEGVRVPRGDGDNAIEGATMVARFVAFGIGTGSEDTSLEEVSRSGGAWSISTVASPTSPPFGEDSGVFLSLFK